MIGVNGYPVQPSMDRGARTVGRLRLRTGDTTVGPRVRTLVEEALRLTTLPGEDQGRIYFFRRLRLPAIGVRDLSSTAWIGRCSAHLLALGSQAAHAADPRAASADAVFFNSIQEFIQQSQTSSIREVYSWILGRLVTAGWDGVLLVLPYVVLSTGVIFLHRRLLDALMVGEDETTSLGISVRRVRLIVVVAATLGTAAVVAVGGTIAFVGIIVPHTVRLLVGRSYRVVIPLSLLFGAAFLVLADTVARTIVAPGEVPIGVITAFVGAPFFIVVMRSTRAAAL